MKSFLKTHQYTIILVAILIIAAAMRFYKCDYSLGNDELSELIRAKESSLSDIIHHKIFEDVHPAGKLVFTHLWVEAFGDSEFSLRFPFVIAGVLSVLMIFLIGARWFGKNTGLFAAASLTFLQFPLLYSQISRTYSSGLFLTLTAAYFWTRLLFDYDNKKVWKNLLFAAGFALSVSASMYNHYFSFLFAGIICISGIFFLNNRNIWYYLASGVFILLLFIPHVSVTLTHFGKGGLTSWLGKPDKDAFFTYVLYIFNDSFFLTFLFTGIMLSTFLVLRKKIRFTRFHAISVVWFILPFVIIYFYSVYKSPVLQNSGLIFTIPYLLLLIFSFIPQHFSRKLVIILFLFLSVGIVHTVFIRKYYSKYHLESFRELAYKMAEYQKKFGKKNVTFTTVVNNKKYIDFYIRKTGMDISLAQTYNINGEDLRVLKNILDTCKTEYFVHSQTFMASDETDALIRTKYPCLKEKLPYGQNTFIRLYSRNTGSSCIPIAKPDTSLIINFDDGASYDKDTSCLTYYYITSPPFSVKLDSTQEFGPVVEFALGHICKTKPKLIRLSISALFNDTAVDAMLVCELKTADKKYDCWASASLKNFINPGVIGQAFLTFYVNKHASLQDIIAVYVWNPGKKVVVYDDIKLDFYH